MKRTWYRIFDPNPKSSACYRISPSEAQYWNDRNWGIFWSVNEIEGRRLNENVVKINSWYFEMDRKHGFNKIQQWQMLRKGLLPSLVIETRNGFHVYFNAKDGTTGNWNAIVSDRLIPFYSGDPNVKDLARILRVPGFYHCKDPRDRFLVRVAFESDAVYSEADMLSYFKPRAKPGRPAKVLSPKPSNAGDDVWERIWQMDCEHALERLSGTDYVNGEVYTFKPVHGGKANLIVNGEQTSCWIDLNRRIGSHSGGGPTIWNWLKWYGYTDRQVADIMREMFPEVMGERKAG